MGDLVEVGIPIWLDDGHRNAYNKLIIYDNCIIQTGSYNLKKGVDLMDAENGIYAHPKDLVTAYLAKTMHCIKPISPLWKPVLFY